MNQKNTPQQPPAPVGLTDVQFNQASLALFQRLKHAFAGLPPFAKVVV